MYVIFTTVKYIYKYIWFQSSGCVAQRIEGGLTCGSLRDQVSVTALFVKVFNISSYVFYLTSSKQVNSSN